MNQSQTVLQILYRTEKSAVSMMETALKGVVMEPKVAAIYQRKKATVAELEKRLGKGKGASHEAPFTNHLLAGVMGSREVERA